MYTLSISNFFDGSYFILDPLSKDLSTTDRAIATAASVVLGIASLGIAHLVCGYRYALHARVKTPAERENTGTLKKIMYAAFGSFNHGNVKPFSHVDLPKVQPKPEDIESYVSKGDISTVKKLLERFSELVKHRDQSGRTLLYYAKDKEMLELLLQKGVDPNIGDRTYGRTPLFYFNNNPEMIKLLLDYGANRNQYETYETAAPWTALMWARHHRGLYPNGKNKNEDQHLNIWYLKYYDPKKPNNVP